MDYVCKNSGITKSSPHSTGYCNTCCMKRPRGKLVLGRKLGNYMIFNGIHLFSRNEDFGETHQKSHFLLILTI